MTWASFRRLERDGARPEDIFLLVEVADSSLAYDRGDKRERYARNGIREMWVVRLDTNEVEVSRQPSAEGYGSTETFGADATLSVEASPGVTIAVRDCLPEPDTFLEE